MSSFLPDAPGPICLHSVLSPFSTILREKWLMRWSSRMQLASIRWKQTPVCFYSIYDWDQLNSTKERRGSKSIRRHPASDDAFKGIINVAIWLNAEAITDKQGNQKSIKSKFFCHF